MVTFGGEDPAAFIRQHANRAGYFHFKDGSRAPDGKPIFLELGRGFTDLKASMAAAREAAAEWIVAEQDRTDLPHRAHIDRDRTPFRLLTPHARRGAYPVAPRPVDSRDAAAAVVGSTGLTHKERP